MEKQIVHAVKFHLRPYTKKEMRLLYGNVPESTFRRWLKEIPETANTGSKNWLTIDQVAAILRTKGVPGLREFN